MSAARLSEAEVIALVEAATAGLTQACAAHPADAHLEMATRQALVALALVATQALAPAATP